MQKEKSGGGGIEPLLLFEPVLNNNRTAWYNGIIEITEPNAVIQ